MAIHKNSEATISGLKKEGIAWTPLLYVIVDWLENRRLIEKEKKIGRGRPRLCYKLTERGKDALLSLWTREVESLVLQMDGRREGTVRIMIPERRNGKTEETVWRAQRLGADRLVSLFRLVTTNPPFLSAPFLGRGAGESLMIVKDLKQNPDLELLEMEIWSYCVHRIKSDLFKSDPSTGDRITQKFFDFDSLRLPDESCMDQDLQLAKEEYRKYWKRRLEEVPETRRLLPYWERLLRGRGEAVRKRREYIKRRLAKDPNYVLPSPLWFELGFNVPQEFSGGISFPYNATIIEPACIGVVFDVFWVFQQMAFQTLDDLVQTWKRSPAGSSGLIGEYLFTFLHHLEKYQKSKEFYEAWTLLRELPSIIEKRKEGEIFGPIEKAVLRHIKTGEFVDLARVYSELAQEKLKTFEEASKAVEAGYYAFSK